MQHEGNTLKSRVGKTPQVVRDKEETLGREHYYSPKRKNSIQGQ